MIWRWVRLSGLAIGNGDAVSVRTFRPIVQFADHERKPRFDRAGAVKRGPVCDIGINGLVA